ncbi:MAG TPA: single-stranded DNA-binding protein [Pseudonocardia sp.]|jgi:single-strand DNA-binding protein|uniref:single-stranded DNA-binding protein n=1 Tax=Pseudonocardia sp. TaxID=60912 RepID=UPI002F423F06
MNETVTTVVGNVITDVRHRRVKDGTPVSHFRMASSERRFDKAAEKWVDGERFYVSVTCWRRLANNVMTCLGKGDPVVVTGRLYTREYELNGHRNSVTELDAVSIGPDLGRCEVSVYRARRDAVADAAAEPALGSVVPLPSSSPEDGTEVADTAVEDPPADAQPAPVGSAKTAGPAKRELEVVGGRG